MIDCCEFVFEFVDFFLCVSFEMWFFYLNEKVVIYFYCGCVLSFVLVKSDYKKMCECIDDCCIFLVCGGGKIYKYFL